jgi:hypothetical protein
LLELHFCYTFLFCGRSDLLKQPATNLLLTRDNRSDRTTCSKSVEINRSVPTCSNRPVASCFCQVCSKLVVRPATNLCTTNNFCPVTTSFNKPVVGKQIENVSKEKNRTKWTLPASLSHSIIAIGGNIKSHRRDYSIYSVIKCKSRCFIFKK